MLSMVSVLGSAAELGAHRLRRRVAALLVTFRERPVVCFLRRLGSGRYRYVLPRDALVETSAGALANRRYDGERLCVEQQFLGLASHLRPTRLYLRQGEVCFQELLHCCRPPLPFVVRFALIVRHAKHNTDHERRRRTAKRTLCYLERHIADAPRGGELTGIFQAPDLSELIDEEHGRADFDGRERSRADARYLPDDGPSAS